MMIPPRILTGADVSSNISQKAYAIMLKECASVSALPEGKRIHAHIMQNGSKLEALLGNYLVEMYHKCGASVKNIHDIFGRTLNASEISWNRLIAAYGQDGQLNEVMKFLQHTEVSGFKINQVTFVTILSSFLDSSSLAICKVVHAHILIRDLHLDLLVGSALINLYRKCKNLVDAQKVFNSMCHLDIVLYTAMIAAHEDHGDVKEVMQLFHRMLSDGIQGNFVTFVTILNAFTSLTHLPLGKLIHSHIINERLQNDVMVGTALIDMYGKLGVVNISCRVFDCLPMRNIVAWNTIIYTYSQSPDKEGAILLFWRMQRDMNHDDISVVNVLNACTSALVLPEGRLIHAHIICSRCILSIYVSTALVNMYGQCGSMENAHNIFKNMPDQNKVSWTAMISACCKEGDTKGALQLFYDMQKDGFTTDAVAFIGILDASASLGMLQIGKLIHCSVIKYGFDSQVIIGNSLINMYGRYGKMEALHVAFQKLDKPDIVSWNAVILAHLQNDSIQHSMKLLSEMKAAGTRPDAITFITIISSCSHTGSITVASHFFLSISRDHHMAPTGEHYSCMIDLIGRVGWLDVAEDFIDCMPFEPDLIMWITLLSACRTYEDMHRGAHVIQYVQKLDCRNSSAYIAMSNIYAGDWKLECGI